MCGIKFYGLLTLRIFCISLCLLLSCQICGILSENDIMLWMKFSRKDSKRAQDNGSLRMKSICIFSSIPVCIIITCQKIIANDVYNTCSLWYLICRDAAALAEFWVWLEEEIDKDVKLTEVDAADKLLEFRSKQAGFIDTSFDTISGILTFL